MYFHEFHGIKISALAAAVPDMREQIMDYADQFPAGEIEKFCKSTGIYERYSGMEMKTTASDLCVAAAKEIFSKFNIDKNSIDALIFLSQTPDYLTPPTSCVIQYRLGLENCDLAYDSNIGCTGFPYGIQMACTNLMAGCRRVLLLVGESFTEHRRLEKDDLLYGDCGIAAILERTDDEIPAIRSCIHTIGEGYQTLISPYGMYRHPIGSFYKDRGIEDVLAFNNKATMQGTDVFTFSIKDAPKTTKAFYERFNCSPENYDLVSIHQANKMIVENVAKRIKIPTEKILWSLDRYGNTRGTSTALNICDYAEKMQVYSGTKHILNLAFGIGLNIALADFEIDMGCVLPIIKTAEAFDDNITNFTYFTEHSKE